MRGRSDLAAAGAVAHAGPADVVARAEVVVTILSGAAATRSAALDAGMLAAMAPGAVWAQIGTIGVAATEELAGVVAAQRPDVMFVDAPVSGTRGPAEAGELFILASGPQAARARVGPAFGAVGQGPEDGQRRRLPGLRAGVGGQGHGPGPGRRPRPVA